MRGRKNIVIFIITTLFYILMLVTGIIGAIIFYQGSDTGFFFTLFLLIACIFPGWFTYYSKHDPFDWGTSTLFFILAILFSVVCAVGYFLYLLTIDSVSGFVVPMTIALVLVYILQFVGFCRWCKEDSSIAYFFTAIGTILLAPIAIAWGVIYSLWYFIKLLLSMLGFTFKSAWEMNGKKEIYEIYDGGYKRTLEYDGYDYDKKTERYKDDLGRYWYTDDKGKSFYQ